MSVFGRIRDFFMQRFDRNRLEKIFKVRLADDADMRELAEMWLRIYQGRAPWTGTNKEQILNTLNFASTLCSDLAKMCVSELAMQETTDEALSAFWNDEVLRDIRTQLEYALSGGAVAIRPYHNEALNKISLSWYTADRFIPADWQSGRPMGGIFVDRDIVNDNGAVTYFTKLECHTWIYDADGNKGKVKISVKAFKSSSPDDLSKEISLAEHAKWADIPPEAEIINLDEPLFVYMRTPFSNNKSLNNQAGVSIYKDAISILENLDRAYDDLCWEMQSTQNKIFVDQSMIEVVRKGNGDLVPRLDDKEKRLFKVMDADGAVGRYMDVYSPAIRQADITQTLKTNLSLLCSAVHLDSGSYVFEENTGAITAREVTAKRQKTYQTICDIQNWCITPALKTLYNVVKEMQSLYGVHEFKEEELAVSFGDSILTDEDSARGNAQAEVANGLRSKLSYLMEYRGLTEEEAQAELERMKTENPVMSGLFGGGSEE